MMFSHGLKLCMWRAPHVLFLKKGVPLHFSYGLEIFFKLAAGWENMRNTSIKKSKYARKIWNNTLFTWKTTFTQQPNNEHSEHQMNIVFRFER